MRGTRTAIRRSLVFCVLCLFAAARIASAGPECQRIAMDCLPAATAAAEHGKTHRHGEICAVPMDSSLRATTGASFAKLAHAPPAIVTVALTASPRRLLTPRSQVRRARGEPSLVVTSGRFRL